MIAARVDRHVGRVRHVAIDAHGPGCSRLMEMVVDRIILSGRVLMAGRANLIAFILESGRVRIVAIAALDSFVEHFALQERAVNVIFVSDLPIGVVDRFLNGLHCVKLIETTSGSEAFVDD